jgi:hypothetical protein
VTFQRSGYFSILSSFGPHAVNTRLAGIAVTAVLAAVTLVLLTAAPKPPTGDPPAELTSTPESVSPPASEVRGSDGSGPPAEPDTPPADTPTKDVVELDPAKQDAIWEAEHVTFEIEQVFGKLLLDALCDRDTARLASLLKPEFAATVFVTRDALVREQSGVREVQADEASEQAALPAADFSAMLVDLLSDVESVQSRTLRVLNISRTGDESWNTRLLVSVAGPTTDGGLIEIDITGFADFAFKDEGELNGQPVVTSWRDESFKRRTTARPLMVEATTDVGLDAVNLPDNWNLKPKEVAQYRFQMAVEDFDRDGWLDIAASEFGRVHLLRFVPETGRFEEVGRDYGVGLSRNRRTMPNALAGWIDFDNDGFPDLLLGNRFYRNEQGRRFVDITEQSGLSFGPQAMGANVVDYDGDGRLDLYILYQASPQSERPDEVLPWINDENYGEPNVLWRNLGDGRFQDVTVESNAGAGKRHTLAATWFFYDDDHFPDVYVANDLSTNSLLRNNGDGTFRDVSEESRTTDFATSMGVAAGDTDNDGTSDLYVANMFSKMGRRIIAHVCEADYPPGIYEQIQGSCAGNRLYRRDPARADFDEFGAALGVDGVGWAYAPAMADLDNDGWLDLYATTGFLSFKRGEPDG